MIQQYEFNTTIEKGMINIPANILNNLSAQVRVVIQSNKEYNFTKQNFTALKLQTQGFKFNRDEANER